MIWNPDEDGGIAARDARITGKPQRIEPLAEHEMDADALHAAQELRRAFKLDLTQPIPEVLRTMLRHPGLFQVQMQMGIELIGRATVPPRDRELAVLRNAWLCGAPYEWGEHVDIAQRHGVTREEIERCTLGSTAEGWTEHDRAVLQAVEQLHADCAIADATWDVLVQSWSEQQLIEFLQLVGHYAATAMMQNALRVRLMDGNPGLGYR